jgi:pimeloyl-ACP methyl ester carboxylesterase
MGGTVSRLTQPMLEGLRSWGFSVPGEVDLDRLAKEFGPYFEQIKVAHAHHYGPDYWRAFLKQISTLWLTLPTYSDRQLASISVPSLVIMGDRDQLGGIDEADRLYRHLGAGELSIIANVGHEAVNKPLFWDAVREFLARHDERQD